MKYLLVSCLSICLSFNATFANKLIDKIIQNSSIYSLNKKYSDLINKPDKKGNYAIGYAIKLNRYKVIKQLIKSKAKLNVKHTYTFKHDYSNKVTKYSHSLLLLAARYRRNYIFEMLTKAGLKSTQKTLIKAVKIGSDAYNCITYMMSNSKLYLDKNTKMKEGKLKVELNAPLYYITDQYLLSNLISNFPKLNYSVQNSNGNTLLHKLVREAKSNSDIADTDYENIHKLLRANVDSHLKNNKQRKPIHYAKKNSPIYKLLKKFMKAEGLSRYLENKKFSGAIIGKSKEGYYHKLDYIQFSFDSLSISLRFDGDYRNGKLEPIKRKGTMHAEAGEYYAKTWHNQSYAGFDKGPSRVDFRNYSFKWQIKKITFKKMFKLFEDKRDMKSLILKYLGKNINKYPKKFREKYWSNARSKYKLEALLQNQYSKLTIPVLRAKVFGSFDNKKPSKDLYLIESN